jgi:dipeptidyl aminopeptidase/acylaminoacyl peptidase
MRRFQLLAWGVILVAGVSVIAQELRTAVIAVEYARTGDQIYVKDGVRENKLDVYARKGTDRSPVAIVFHGAPGTKENAFYRNLPLLEMGVSVVLPQGSNDGDPAVLAPRRAAEGRCALQWVVTHADQFHFDTNRIVLAGASAGGFTALITGLATTSAGIDRLCPGHTAPKIAAIINFYGATTSTGALAGLPQLAPVTYVRAGIPPILTVHGDADEIIPFSEGVALDEALTRAGAVHEFLRIPGARHGHNNWEPAQVTTAWSRVRDFLKRHDVVR